MIARLWGLVQPNARSHFAILMVLVSVGGFVELAGISATAELMGLVASQGERGPGGPMTRMMKELSFTEPSERLKFGLVWAIVVLFFVHGYTMVRSYLKAKFIWIQDEEISSRLFQSCLERPYSWFLQQNSGELHRVLGSGHFVQGLLGSFLSAIGSFAVAGTLVVALLVVDPVVAVVGFIVVSVAYYLVQLFTQNSVRTKGKAAHVADAQRRVTAQEALTSVRFLKTTGSERFFADEYAEQTHRASKGMVYHSIYVDTVRAFLEWVTFAGILSLSVYLVLQSQNLETLLPRLTLYTMAGYRLVPAVHSIFGLWTRLKFDTEYLERVEHLLHYRQSRSETDPSPQSVEGLEEAEHLVRFEKVCFRYESADRDALKNIDLQLGRGEWLGVVGTTGAGKTTLLDLISGLCSPTAGQVIVGRSELGPDCVKDWQKRIGVVPQEVILLDDSISRNVAFGVAKDEIDLKLVTKVCHLAGLEHFLEQLPDGLETKLGERGTRLSGGERQRVGIARALYRRPLLLLLDEATSALDQATEARIIETLKSLSKDCTLVTVAHRLSSVQPCDQIVVVENGQIASKGTFDELLVKSPLFKALALHTA